MWTHNGIRRGKNRAGDALFYGLTEPLASAARWALRSVQARVSAADACRFFARDPIEPVGRTLRAKGTGELRPRSLPGPLFAAAKRAKIW